MEEFTINHRDDIDAPAAVMREFAEGAGCIVRISKIVNPRTSQQNRAIFKYYRLIADMLADAGFTARSYFETLKNGFEVDITMQHVRDVVEKVSMDKYKKEVKDLSTVEIQALHRTVDHAFSLQMGVSHEFPSDEPPVYGGAK